jgi:aminoglycoside phosphotransferase (APT) family kinase protein
MEDLGRLLRQLHALPRPTDFDPGAIQPLVSVRMRIHMARMLDEDDRDWFYAKLRELAVRWYELPTGRPPCVVHGDAWAGNVAVTDDGTAILLDFERSSYGPPEWDLAHSAIKYTSFGWSPGEYEKLATQYGYDVATEYPGFETLRDIRELRMTTFALQCAKEDPKFEAEARLRVDSIRGRLGPRPWAGWHPTP